MVREKRKRIGAPIKSIKSKLKVKKGQIFILDISASKRFVCKGKQEISFGEKGLPMMKKIAMIAGVLILMLILIVSVWLISRPDRGTTGAVSTQFRWIGPNDKIVVDGFDDPKVQGVACHIARAQTGGVKGALSVAKDASDASIACRQIGPIKFLEKLKNGEQVFDEQRSLLFKSLQVVRFYDRKRNVLVYLSYSDRVLTGSPKKASAPCPSCPGRRPTRLW